MGDIDLEQFDIDLPEIQEIDAHKVVKAKLEAALAHHEGPFIVDDVSVRCGALNGLPGPFIKWFLLNAVMLTAVFFAEQKGAISTIIKNDLSYISILIMVLYVLVSAYVGKLCYLCDKINDNK